MFSSEKNVGKCGYAYVYMYVNAGIRSPPTTITRLMVEGLSCQRCHRSNRTPCHWSRWCILSRHCQMVLHVFIHGNTSTMSIRCKFNTVEKCQKEKQSRNTLHQETQLKANATSQSEQHDAASMYCRTNENGRTTARGGENTHTWLGVHFQKKILLTMKNVKKYVVLLQIQSGGTYVFLCMKHLIVAIPFANSIRKNLLLDG